MDIRPFINYLIDSKTTEEEALKLLTANATLSREEKNLIYRYCYPRPLLDKELPSRVQSYRASCNKASGFLVPDSGETTLIIEAGRTAQYGRFIKHLMHSFGDPNLIHPLEGNEKHECPLCGKVLYEADLWKSLVDERPGTPEANQKEYLAYGSDNSEVTLCTDCLIQLISAINIINDIDPSFLDWTKRSSKSIKHAWDAFKL